MQKKKCNVKLLESKKHYLLLEKREGEKKKKIFMYREIGKIFG